VCQDERQALFLAELLESFEIEAKIILRKRYHVLYVKDGTKIVEMLNVMGAHIALMDFENMRILKEMRNSVNRKVNCETANIGKTVNAAQRQIEDIKQLMKTDAYRALPPALMEIADLRVMYPEATLKELGELSTPAIGKSGVNHRLRKLSKMAEELKGGEL
jgi:DNA-binding protein WhiA